MEYQNWPVLHPKMNVMQAFELLLTTERINPELLNAAVFIMWVHDTLVAQYPEIEHLLKQRLVSDRTKMKKAKQIFKIED